MGIRGGVKRILAVASLVMFASPIVSAKYVEAVPGEYIVKMKKSYSVKKLNMFSFARDMGVYIKDTIPSGNLVVVKRASFETQDSAIASLQENPMVEYAEPNFIYHAVKTPNDPLFGNLWGLKNVGQKDSSGAVGVPGVDVDMERAWDINTGSDSVLVAVVDTGIDYNHPDLKDNVWVNEAEANGKAGVDDDGNGIIDDIHGANFVNDKAPTGDPMDDHGHGSHCSGTIGAKGNDGAGIVGVNWNVKILGAKFLSADGSGSLEGAIKAIDYATSKGARIMSNSWGGGGFSQTLKDAIERANDKGILFIAAAGNDSADNDSDPHYPSSYDSKNIVSVAAIDNQGKLARFSNYGKKSVHIGAPGVNIYSSLNGGGYDSWSGTSMATPHVSGVAALLAANEPGLTHMQLKERLLGTNKPIGGLKGKVSTGGMVNAFFALTNQVAPPDANDPANWASKPAAISTAHPYKSKAKETYEASANPTSSNEVEVSVAGATQIAVYFSKFETERTYDKVTFFDKNGNKVGELSGLNNDSYSPVIGGDYVKMVFTSDDSVEKYGFDVSKIAYK